MVFLEIKYLEYLAYIFLFALFIIVFTNIFYLCLLFDKLKLPSDPDAPDDPDDHNDPEEVLEDIIDIEPIYVMLYLFYIPERVPYDREIQKVGLIPYQRKKRPKLDENFFNSFLSKVEEKLVKDNTGVKVVKEKLTKDNIVDKIVKKNK
ncbi:hypothetical protein C1646_745505 [Rhizophagus diaphanus]|nr:hypothetical protein C1646_745505 [Rhizophagus diaphanus] [Rhizophagus sp. MUCL 43196]